jgi:hypothetical protein
MALYPLSLGSVPIVDWEEVNEEHSRGSESVPVAKDRESALREQGPNLSRASGAEQSALFNPLRKAYSLQF